MTGCGSGSVVGRELLRAQPVGERGWVAAMVVKLTKKRSVFRY